jgi:cardiolipin synthase
VRLANVVGAAFTHRRVIEPIEARIATWAGAALLVLAILFALFPRVLAYPLVALSAWVAIALLVQGYRLHRARMQQRAQAKTEA